MKPYRLLFADSDKNVHSGHRRMIRALKPDWHVDFASTGRDAMSHILMLRPNVIIAELDLPLEDGTDLLQAVQEAYPEIIRIILSSESDTASTEVLRAAQSAHRFLAKPFKGELLIEEIEKAVNLKKLLNSDELLEIVGGIPYLPSLPSLYKELVTAIASPMISLSEIGNIISRDVSMTGRILHLVNSAFFGLPRKISSPQTAVVMLGINVIKSLVFYVKIFFAAPDTILPGLSLDELWAHSSMSARLSREIAVNLKVPANVQEDAFLAGMLHDVGKLLLLEHPRYFQKVLKVLENNNEQEFSEVEYKVWGTSHAEIGAYLLGLWGLPDSVVEAVAYHHKPSLLQFEHSPVLIATHLSNALLSKAKGEVITIDEITMQNEIVIEFFDKWEKKAEEFYQKGIK